jgi:mannose-6-phosphate isomerase-like protein (cupin superfamily)
VSLPAPITTGEPIASGDGFESAIIVAGEELTVTRARCEPGARIAGPHVHRDHTDAFSVLEGELTFEIGRERETVSVPAGGFVAVPAGVAHSFRTAGDTPASWLTIHAPDGGFAAFMRGIRDGLDVDWDFFPVPADGGLPAGEAVVTL